MKKNLSLICQVFYPDDQATSILFTDLMRSLSRDYEIKVFSGYPSTSARSLKNKKIIKREKYENFEVIRCGLKIDVKSGFLNRALSYFSFNIEVLFRIIFLKNSKLMGVTNPFSNLWIMAFAKLLRRNENIYVYLDIYPEGLIALGNLKQNSIFARFWIFLNRISLKMTDKVIVIGRDMFNVLEKYNIKNKITYIPHWSSIKPKKSILFRDSKFINERKLNDKFVIQYSGNMGLWHDMDTYVRCAAKTMNINKITYNFIGGGIKRQHSEDLANQLGLKNISWIDFVDLEDLDQSLAACHLSLISLNNNLEGVAVPSKLYGILASGRPIVASVPKNSEIALTIDEHKCGFVVEPGDDEKLSEIIMDCYQNKYDLKKMGENSFNAFLRSYTVDAVIDEFRKVIN